MPLVRDRHRCRGPGGGGQLRPAGSTTALLRPALEVAVSIARDGERSDPPVPAPASLRRYLSFAKLPDPALEVARRVLDDDDDFRARVAAGVDEASIGRAGWLFLSRPEGWRDDLEALRKEAAAGEAAAREDRAERSAQRRLVGAEAAAARAEAARSTAAAEAERARAELRDERLAARALANEVERLRSELRQAKDDRAATIRRVKEVEAALAERGAELRTLRHELRMVQAELTGGADGDPDRVAPPAVPAVVEVQPMPELAAAVQAAVAASERLSAALATAATLLEPTPAADPVAPVESPEAAAAERAPAAVRRRAEPLTAPGRPARRTPVALPPGVLDDSVVAAEHLVRAGGALLLVDGYNISHAQWYGLTPAEQRSRLLDACAELHARHGTDVEVVFDGSGDEPGGGTLVRSAVRFRFTADGVEADDVILARVAEEPPERPVVVASSDRRVRDGARARGANVLGARQLLAVLRR